MTSRSNRPAVRLRSAAVAALAVGVLGSLAACGGEDNAADPATSAPSESGSASTDPTGTTGTASDPATGASQSPGGPSATPPRGEGRSSENIKLAEPAEGAVVTGSFTASGKANSPEANVPWEIRDGSGKVLRHGFATAEGWMDRLYPWTTEVAVTGLEPGEYTFVAMTDTEAGDEGGVAPEEVSATIVVR